MLIVLKYDGGEGWGISVWLHLYKMKYYIESSDKITLYVQWYEGMVTGLVKSCTGTAP